MIPVWPVNVCKKIVNYRIRNVNNNWIFGLKLPSSAANINAVAPTVLVASIFAQFLMSRSTISWLPKSEKMNQFLPLSKAYPFLTLFRSQHQRSRTSMLPVRIINMCPISNEKIHNFIVSFMKKFDLFYSIMIL